MTQVEECLLCKCEALSSNASITKKKKKTEKKAKQKPNLINLKRPTPNTS
jgi:hypothetical protein